MTETETTLNRTHTATPAMSVIGLSKTYGSGQQSRQILQNVTFDLFDRELVSIVGPSGAGKTTLLRCLAGLLPASSGEVYLGQKQVTAPPRELAVVFQDYSRSLMPWLSVIANVELPLRGRGMAKKEVRERARTALASVGLANHSSHYPWQLSGGMQQRVAIARALAYEPSVLLMDEPFASVDAQTRADLEDLTLSLKERFNMTILVVTHDIEESVYLADRVIVLSGSPTSVQEIIPVEISHPRDQVGSKSTQQFAELRAHILGLVRTPRTKALSMRSEQVIDSAALDVLFVEARSVRKFTDDPVTVDQARHIYELAKLAPTAFNSQPLRILFVGPGPTKARLVSHLSTSNAEKTMGAPLTALLSIDSDWHERLPELFPRNLALRDRFHLDPRSRHVVGRDNAHIQAGYFIMAVRAVGLAAGPMSGFDNDGMDAEFFPEGRQKSILVVNIGHASPESAGAERLKRIDFTEAVAFA